MIHQQDTTLRTGPAGTKQQQTGARETRILKGRRYADDFGALVWLTPRSPARRHADRWNERQPLHCVRYNRYSAALRRPAV